MGNSAQCCGQIEATHGVVRTHLDESGEQHVGGKALARNAWGWLRGCWGVQWLCRLVLDITRSPGKIHGSGGVGMGYDNSHQNPYAMELQNHPV